MRTFAVLVMLLLVGACGAGSSDSDSDSEADSEAVSAVGPEKAVEQLLTALEAGSCKDVKKLVVTPAAIDCEMIASLAGSYAADGIDLADVTYAVDDIIGDSGAVNADMGDGKPADSWNVERFDGTWKVVFDSEE